MVGSPDLSIPSSNYVERLLDGPDRHISAISHLTPQTVRGRRLRARGSSPAGTAVRGEVAPTDASSVVDGCRRLSVVQVPDALSEWFQHPGLGGDRSSRICGYSGTGGMPSLIPYPIGPQSRVLDVLFEIPTPSRSAGPRTEGTTRAGSGVTEKFAAEAMVFQMAAALAMAPRPPQYYMRRLGTGGEAISSPLPLFPSSQGWRQGG